MSKSSKGGTTHVQVKNSSIGWVAVAVVAGVLLMGGIGKAIPTAMLNGAGSVADRNTFPLPGNANRLNEQAAKNQPTTPTTVSDQEMAAREAAKQTGDKLMLERDASAPEIGSGGGGESLPKLGDGPSGGLLGELPAVGGALKALGNGGLKALEAGG